VPRFNAEISFDLVTTIEPEGIRFDIDAEEVEDSSYFQAEEITSSGGSITCVIEADDESTAERMAEELIGSEVEDYNSLTWGVENVSVSVEAIEEPMTMERAEAILIGLAEGQSDPAVKEAVEFVFDRLTAMDARLSEATQRIDGLVERVRLAETTTTETVPA